MTKKNWFAFILLNVFVFYNSSKAEYSFVFEEKIQKFRVEIFLHQSEALDLIDKAFFELYNTISSMLINKVSQPYMALGQEFNKSCSDFPIYSLENYAARRLIVMCDEFKRFQRRIRKLSEEIILQYYPNPGDLTEASLMEILVDEHFGNMEKQLGLVVPIFNQNPNCVTKLFGQFLDIYTTPVSKIIEAIKKAIKSIQNASMRDFRLLETGVSRLYGVSNRMVNCSQEEVIDTFGCIKAFINFNCKKRRSYCGPVYKTMRAAVRHLVNIKTFFTYYENSYDSFYVFTSDAENLLLNWLKEVENCIKSK